MIRSKGRAGHATMWNLLVFDMCCYQHCCVKSSVLIVVLEDEVGYRLRFDLCRDAIALEAPTSTVGYYLSYS